MSRIAMTIAAFLFASVPLAQAADSAEEFYKGKTITYVVSTAPGGGYDTYGRLVARYMNKYMPDSKIIIRNIPGAGHVVGANTIYAAKPDGLTIGTFNTGLIYLQLLKESGVRFDLAKMSWIGKAASDTRVLVVSKSSGVKTVQELLDSSKPPIKLFAAGVGSAGYIDTRLAISALHLNVQLIPGYNGSEGTMSMLRGETQGTIGSQSSYTQFVDDGNGVYIMEAGGPADSKIPQAGQFAKDDNARQLLKMIAAESDVARLTAGPPGIPADRLALLRSIFMKAMADPQLLADAKKMDAPIAPATGEHVQQVIAEALQQTPQNLQLLTQAVKAGQ
ncbi:MAG: hypothetical protein JWR07_1516 [Nevskia sp.]|nr:hypothetical protein [Nevskia sp.]